MGRWSTRRAGRFALIAATGAGACAAYLISEITKVIVQEDRPCRAVTSEVILACPPADDWSWRSSHGSRHPGRCAPGASEVAVVAIAEHRPDVAERTC